MLNPRERVNPDVRVGRRPFLSADWRDLAMINYSVPPELLEPLVPSGTTLDDFGGHYFVSLVGFRFIATRVLGVPVPGHRNFIEVNLRFYVRRATSVGSRRGVPRAAVAIVARTLYNEPYTTVGMRHNVERSASGDPNQARYEWRCRGGEWGGIEVRTAGDFAAPLSGSVEEFISRHHWGYTRQRDGSTFEYRVDHPVWRVSRNAESHLRGSPQAVFGARSSALLEDEPHSSFIADGSAVRVHKPIRI
jgi:hypothetical protein